ncbi:MAG: hypothetical protein WAK86_13210 [Pseudonocardiaceae bacterium]
MTWPTYALVGQVTTARHFTPAGPTGGGEHATRATVLRYPLGVCYHPIAVWKGWPGGVAATAARRTAMASSLSGAPTDPPAYLRVTYDNTSACGALRSADGGQI